MQTIDQSRTSNGSVENSLKLWIQKTSTRQKSLIRWALFIYLCLAFCPVTYLSPVPDPESSWYYALNLAASHHLMMGHDIIWTTGPLSYLILPMDVGHNLAWGLIFQLVIWACLSAILFDLCFRGNVRLRNLAFFSAFIGLSARLFQYPSVLGVADALMFGSLLLLVQFRLRGGWFRYYSAVAALSLVPLLKVVDLIIVAIVVGGLVLDLLLHRHPNKLRELVLLFAAPVLSAMGLWLTIGSWHAIALYIRGSLELSRGYSAAMSLYGSPVELVAALEAFCLLGVAAYLLLKSNRRLFDFVAIVFALPVFMKFKHGFVRQDLHILYFFCFIALVMALCVLMMSINTWRRAITLAVLFLLMGTIWVDDVARVAPKTALASILGVRPLLMIIPALRFEHLQQRLQAEELQKFTDEDKIEGWIRTLIGNEPIAVLSPTYSYARQSNLNLKLYPVLERYGAYTPYLDGLNAAWIRDNGPRYLLFDAKSIDGRHPWTETPAMWLEVYRWYDFAFEGPHNLLLQRRSQPRFSGMQAVSHLSLKQGEVLHLPRLENGFWKVSCPISEIGHLRELAFRISDVTLTLHDMAKGERTFRALPEVLNTPMPGGSLPTGLHEFAELFQDHPHHWVESLSLGGPGLSAYKQECQAEILTQFP
jgi:hypothetical protein